MALLVTTPVLGWWVSRGYVAVSSLNISAIFARFYFWAGFARRPSSNCKAIRLFGVVVASSALTPPPLASSPLATKPHYRVTKEIAEYVFLHPSPLPPPPRFPSREGVCAR